MNPPNFKHTLLAGFVGGVVLNLIDTPWSVLVMVPRMQVFLDAHDLKSDDLTGPWFLLTHVLFTTGIAWIYGLMVDHYGRGTKTSLIAGMTLLTLNRAFGFGNVLMGTLPANMFLGFSISFLVGTLLAAVASAKVMDRLSK